MSTEQERFHAASQAGQAMVHFVIVFSPEGRQISAGACGPYVDPAQALRWAKAQARVDRSTAYVVGVSATSVDEVTP